MSKKELGLKAVPETMLWTLHNRASESLRSDGIIKDTKAEEIYKSIDYDYEKNFGKADASHAVRSLDFDKEIKYFLEKYPHGTIINLGEGLETQRYRVENSSALWVTIDLPQAIKAREQFIQPDERHIHIPISATDTSWFNVIPKDNPVFITAQGLFMYFYEEDVKKLLQNITSNFKKGYIMFDIIPKWMSKIASSDKGWKKTKHYTVPKCPWGINRDELKPTFENWLDEDIKVNDIGFSSFPRGAGKWLFSFFQVLPILKHKTASIVRIDF